MTPTPLHPWPICWSQHVPGLNGNEGGRMGGLTFTFSGHFIWERVIKFITNVLFSLSWNMEIKHLNRLTLTGFCRRFHLRCLERQKYRWSKEFRLLKMIISPILYTVCPLHIYINGFTQISGKKAAITIWYSRVSACCECCCLSPSSLVKLSETGWITELSDLIHVQFSMKVSLVIGSQMWPFSWWTVHQPAAHRMWEKPLILGSVLSRQAILLPCLWFRLARISCT